MITQPKAATDKALVYVYRVTDGRWVGRVDVSVDGKKIAGIGDWEFSWCYLVPGDHTFRAEWGLMDKPMFEEGHFDPKTLNFKIEANKIYYVCYAIRENGSPPTMLEKGSGVLGNLGLVAKAASKSHVTSVELLPEDEVRALPMLTRCDLRESEMSK